MKRILATHLPRNFFTAFAVLLAFKLALVGNNIFGTEAFESGGVFISKIPLLIGNDILGAFLLGLVVTLISSPLFLRGKERVGLVLSGVLQGAHSALAGVSFFASIYIGGPLNREVMELATNGGGATTGDEAPALWSSIAHYLGAGQISTALGGILLGTLVFVFFPRIEARVKPRLRKLVAGALIIEAAVGVLLLPWLINGHIAGIRIHTFGLERSAGIELAWSYTKPAFSWLHSSGPPLADEFVLDMSSIAAAEGEGEGEGEIAPLMTGATPARTNVIFISLESVSEGYIEEDPARMPFLSSVAKSGRGVYFENHYSVWPQTMKAFFSFHCAELPYPTYESISFVNPAIPCVSISQALKRGGYDTALITSADLAYDRKRRFFQHREFDLMMDMRDMPGREDVWGDSWGLDERLAVSHILKLAEEKRDADKPFFVFYEMFTAHHPYNACQEHVDEPLEEYPAYLRALTYIDDRVRDIVEGLERLGMAENTLVVAAADHGEGFGQHPGSRGHGAKVYQENVHVPFVIIGPQVKDIAGRVSYATSHIDIAPTILGLVDLPVPCTMKGRALNRSREARMSFFGGRPPGGQKGLADGRWKYIIEDNGMEELFDLQTDPEERNSVLTDHQNLAARYKTKIEEWERFSENLIENYSDVLSRSDCRP